LNKDKENKSQNIDYCEDILSNKSMEESKVGYIITSNRNINSSISPLKHYRSESKIINLKSSKKFLFLSQINNYKKK
jgi:hypothetical protein